MNNFKVTIVEENGDLDIYTEATAIDIDKKEIKVTYEDKQATHQDQPLTKGETWWKHWVFFFFLIF